MSEKIANLKMNGLELSSLSIQNLKEEMFLNFTPLEIMMLLSKMQEDLLCSSITDSDTAYRNEIIMLTRTLGKVVVALKKNVNPNQVDFVKASIA